MTTQDQDIHTCVLAALILHDGGIPITGDKTKTVLAASNNSDVQLVYGNIVAKFLEGKDIPALLTEMQTLPQHVSSKADADWDMLSDAGGSDNAAYISEGPWGDVSDDDIRYDLFD